MTPIGAKSFLRAAILTSVGAAGLCLLSVQATAFEPNPNEKADLKACEKSLCEMILKKEASGPDLQCALSKTWDRTKIEKGVGEKKLKWGFGDARCGVDLSVARDKIVSPLTKAEYALVLDAKTVKCEIEGKEESTKVSVTMAPKVTFKDGKAQKAWLNVTKIEAPAVLKAGIWSAAKLEDTIGLFHGEMIDEINDFVHNKCAKRYGEKAAKKKKGAKQAKSE